MSSQRFNFQPRQKPGCDINDAHIQGSDLPISPNLDQLSFDSGFSANYPHFGLPDFSHATPTPAAPVPGTGSFSHSGIDDIRPYLKNVQEAPWDPISIRGSDQARAGATQLDASGNGILSGIWTNYRDHAPPSECATSVPGIGLSANGDSGYGSNTVGIPSVYGGSELNADLNILLNDLSSLRSTGEPDSRASAFHGTQTLPRTDGTVEKCPGCNQILKTPSDRKKHETRHSKPFLCKVPGCVRKDGFGTRNDLDRHRKTVHEKGPGWRCSEVNCDNSKDWPRADNFRQHLKKIHNIIVPAEASLERWLHNPLSRPDLETETQVDKPLSLIAQSDTDALLSFQSRSSASFCRTVPSDRKAPGEPLSLQAPLQAPPDVNAHLQTLQKESMARIALDTEDVQSSSGSHPFHKRVQSDIDRRAKHNDDQDSVLSITDVDDDDAQSMIRSLQERGLLEKYLAPLGYQRVSSLAEGKRVSCEQCHKTYPRLCDLRKHMKRHEKPFACGFVNCKKTFGSKNDLKRHETSLHQDQDPDIKAPSIASNTGEDVRTVKNIQPFEGWHDMAHNGGSIAQYWCGWCTTMLNGTHIGQSAQDALQAHLNDHKHNRHGLEDKQRSEWKSAQSFQPHHSDSAAFDTQGLAQQNDGQFAQQTVSAGSGQAPNLIHKQQRNQVVQDNHLKHAGPSTDASGRRSRSPEVEGSHHRKKRLRSDWRIWTCCNCGEYNNCSTTTQCVTLDCDHRYCKNCNFVFYHEDNV